MTNEELRKILHDLHVDVEARPTLVYVFYETADGLINNFSISVRRAKTAAGRKMGDEDLAEVMEGYPEAREGKIMAIERPEEGIKRWVDMSEVCRQLNTTRFTLSKWVKNGWLHPARMCRRLYFDEAEVEALLHSNRIQENGRIDKH